MKHGIIKDGFIKSNPRPHAKRPSWYHPALGLAVLLTALPAATVQAQTISTTQTPSEQAQPADSFVDSIGINTPPDFNYGINNVNGIGQHGTNTSDYYPSVEQALINLGVRHLRYGPPDAQTAQDLYAKGLLCLFKADLSDYGYTQASTYSRISGTDQYSILSRIKAGGLDVEGVEGPNEVNNFWGQIQYQQRGFTSSLTGTPAAVPFMQDLVYALKTDPSTASSYTQSLPVIGPSLITSSIIPYDPSPHNPFSTYSSIAGYSNVVDSNGSSPNPWAGLFSSLVNYGNMHPYPSNNGGGSEGGTYDGMLEDPMTYQHGYLHHCNQPSAVIDFDDLNKPNSQDYQGLYLNNILITSSTKDSSWSDVPLDFATNQVAFMNDSGTKLPMFATETGYTSDLNGTAVYQGNEPVFTDPQHNNNGDGHIKPGDSLGGVSYLVQAKYIPRLLAENFRTNVQTQPGSGIVRTYLFSLADDGDGPFGLMQGYTSNNDPMSLSPKPAYTALRSLIALLKEPGQSKCSTAALNYQIDVQPATVTDSSGKPLKYDRTWYVHHLLLQKSTGDYYLVLWHEISDDDTTDFNNAVNTNIYNIEHNTGVSHQIVPPFKELSPPALTTTVTLPSSIGSVTEFAYDPNGSWNLLPTKLTISNNQVQVNVPDQIIVLQLSPPEAAFNGPHTISPAGTTTVQAEDYDVGGYGTAYTAYDQPGASYSAYRPDDLVGIGSTYEAGPLGYYVGWMAQGQFLNYTVTVPEAGNYLLAFRYASGDTSNGNNFSVLDQATGQTTNPIPVSYSGVNGSYPWDTWANTAPVEMALNYGQQTLRLNENTGGYNLDYMTFTRDMNSYPFSVPGGFPIASSGTSTVKTSDFDLGGQDVAYNNTYNDPGNYSAYRPNDQVGLWPCLDTGGGYEVAWTAPGQWLKYTVNVAAAGTYAVMFRVASASGTNSVAGSFHLQDANSNNLTGPVTFNGTGGWDNWASTAPVNVTFKTAGTQTVTLYEDSANFNVNSMTFSAGDTGTAFSSGGATSSTAPKLGGGVQLAAAGTAPIPAQNAFDGSLSSFFASAAGAGYVGQDAGKAVPVTQITYAPRPGYETRMVGGVFEGSNTSTTTGYTTLATVSATPKDGMVNVVKVAGGKTYRYLRFRSSASGYCNVAEIKFQN